MKNPNSIIGLGLIGLAFLLLYFQSKQTDNQPAPQDDFIPANIEREVIESDSPTEPAAVPVATEEDAFSTVEESVTETPEKPKERQISTDLTLSNEYISVDFTRTGGAIKEIRFLQTKRGGPDDFVFNEGSRITALQLSRREPDGRVLLLNYDFTIIPMGKYAVRFEFDTGKGVKFVRSYALGSPDSESPYAINHRTQIVNASTEKPIKIGSSSDAELLLTLGTALPVDSDKRGEFQAFAYYDGDDDEFIKASYFTGSKGFLGIGAKDPRDSYSLQDTGIEWASVKNQFFVSVFTPEQPASSIYAQSIRVPQVNGNNNRSVGIVGEIGFDTGIIQPNSELTINGTYYVGPKEYDRLVRLGKKQDKLMQFGLFGAISKILMSLMYFIHGFVGNWGLSIILMTVIVKAVFWPLTSYSAQSSKKMQLLQEPMKEIREKYQDKPERMQQETMKLFKKYGVNPLAGCLPMLVQIPIFIGLYWMLRTSAELRYEPFLWISDLSRPDTVATIGGFPLNIMPLINGVFMFIQMQMMPMSPTADPNQQRIMKFFPMIFLFIMYGFSSGLVLYWTVQSILSIVQTTLVYRKKENLELKPVAAPAAAKPARPGQRPARKAPRKRK